MHTRTRPFVSLTWPACVVMHVVSDRGRPPRPLPAQSPQMSDAMWELIQCCWKHEWAERRKLVLRFYTVVVLNMIQQRWMRSSFG